MREHKMGKRICAGILAVVMMLTSFSVSELQAVAEEMNTVTATIGAPGEQAGNNQIPASINVDSEEPADGEQEESQETQVTPTALTGNFVINGNVEYSGDDDWKTITRPENFEQDFMLKAVFADGTSKECILQVTNDTDSFYMKAKYQDGGASYTINNVPKNIEGKDVEKYILSAGNVLYYSMNQKEISVLENTTQALEANIEYNLLTSAVNVEKVIPGQPNDTASFSLPYTVLNGDKTKDIQKECTISQSGKSDESKKTTITVPTGAYIQLGSDTKEGDDYKYLDSILTKTKKEDYSETTESVKNKAFQVEDGYTYDVIVKNASKNVKPQTTITWVDNNAKDKRTPTMKLMCAINDGEYFELTSDNCKTKIGLESLPGCKEVTESGKTTYSYSGLPAASDDGKNIYTYKIIQSECPTGYICEEKNGNYTDYLATQFNATVVWNDSSNAAGVRPSIDEMKANYHLYRYINDSYEEIPGTEEQPVLNITENGNTWTIQSNKQLPMYNNDNVHYTYVLVEGEISNTGGITDINVPKADDATHSYNTVYNNGQGEFGNVTTCCHNGQKIYHTIQENITFSAKKVWLDNGTDERPTANVTLYRYSIKDKNNFDKSKIKFEDAAKVVVKNGTTEVLMSYNLNSTSLKESETVKAGEETIDFITALKDKLPENYALPKYDENGYEYFYFVRETLSKDKTYTISYENTKDGENAGISFGAENEGTIKNKRTEQGVIHVNKKWSSPSEIKDYSGKNITFELLCEKVVTDETTNKDKTIYTVVPVLDGSNQIGGFNKDCSSGYTEFVVDLYDENGQPYKFVGVREEAITSANNIHVEEGETNPTAVKFTLNNHQYREECEETTRSENYVFDSEGLQQINYNVKNIIDDKVNYTIVKHWEDGVTPVDLDFNLSATNAIGNAVAMPTGKDKVHMTTNNENIQTIVVEDLPKYDENGYLIQYKAFETTKAESSTGAKKWTTTVHNYTQYKTDVYNSAPEGETHYIYVYKKWLDDGDTSNRYPVNISVFYDDKGTKKNIAEENSEGNNKYREIIQLSENNVWEQRVEVPFDPKTVTYSIEEISVQKDDVTTYKISDNKVTTDQNTYDVSYENSDKSHFTVINKRTGIVNVNIKKIWKDGGDKESRPGSITFLLYQNKELYSNTDKGISDGKLVLNKPLVTQTYSSDLRLMTADADDVNTWEYSLTGLPKYDENGKLYEYSVEEDVSALKDTDYKSICTDFSFKDNTYYYTYTNTREGTTDFSIYKVWRDVATEGANRPDIRMTLYRTTAKKTDDDPYPDGEEYKDYKDQIWEPADNTSSGYNWKISISNLPKYDESGAEYTYYMVESMNNGGVSSDGTYRAHYCSIDDKKTGARVRDLDDALTGHHAEKEITENGVTRTVTTYGDKAYDGEYIVNTLYDEMIVTGTKTWQNTDGFEMDELPNPLIQLYRRLPSQEASDAEKIDELTLNTTYSSDKSGYQFPTEYCEEKVESTDENGNVVYHLPKYSQKGERYVYEVREVITSSSGVVVFSNVNKNNSLTNTFDKDKNVRNISVQKTWDRDTDNLLSNEKTAYPNVTFELYRYEKPSNGEVLSIENMQDGTSITDGDKTIHVRKVAEQTIYADELKDSNGSKTCTFENQLIYSPTGTLYYYYVKEKAINGYSIEYYSSETPSDDTKVSDRNGIDITDTPDMKTGDAVSTKTVSVKNVYDQKGSITVEGQKKWNDYDNAYGLRPDGITVKLYRETTSDKRGEDSLENAVGKEEVVLSKTGDSDPKITWDKTTDSNNWKYTITNLEKYAPNGKPYIYYLWEEPVEYYNLDANKNKQGQSTNKVSAGKDDTSITLNTLENSLSGTYTVEKTWNDGKNKYGFRPESVTVVLQQSTDDGVTWSDVTREKLTTTLSADSSVTDTHANAAYKLTAANVVSGTNGCTWRATFTNLPVAVYDETSYSIKQYKYRCIEYKIGENAFSKDVSETKDDNKIGAYYRTYDFSDSSKTVIDNAMTTTKLKVVKTWDDEDNLYQTRPEKITLKLQKSSSTTYDNSTWDNAKDAKGNPITVELSATTDQNKSDINTWEYTFENLPVCEYGESGNVDLYYRVVESHSDDNRIENLMNYEDRVDYENNKVKVKSGAASEKTYWSYEEAKNLNTVNLANNLIRKDGAIVNTEGASISATKQWVNSDDNPAYAVDFELKSRVKSESGTGEYSTIGTGITKPLAITNDSKKVTWTNLPKYNAAGKELEYAIFENTTDVYYQINQTTTSSGDYHFDNVELCDLTVTKDWEDFSNKYGMRPDDISFDLQYRVKTVDNSEGWKSIKSDNSEISSDMKKYFNTYFATLSDGHTYSSVSGKEKSSNKWTYNFNKLPKYVLDDANKKELEYRVVETEDSNYVCTYGNSSLSDSKMFDSNGKQTITNTLVYAYINLKKTSAENGTDTGTALKGAKFSIYKATDLSKPYIELETEKDGGFSHNPDGSYGSDEKKQWLVPGTYVIKESSAPTHHGIFGFLTGDGVKFRVAKEDEVGAGGVVTKSAAHHLGTAWIYVGKVGETLSGQVKYVNSTSDAAPTENENVINNTTRGTASFTKVDNQGSTIKTTDGEFGVYTEAECTTKVATMKYSNGKYVLQPLDGDAVKTQGVNYLYNTGTTDAPVYSLLDGTYYVKETKAPTGYKSDAADATPRTLTIATDGTFKWGTGDDATDNYKWVNTPMTLSIQKQSSKTDGSGNAINLSDCKFSVTGDFMQVSTSGVQSAENGINKTFTISKSSTDAVVTSSFTDDSGNNYFWINGNTYTVTESKAPAGYKLNTTAQTVKMSNGAENTLTFIDEPFTILLGKREKVRSTDTNGNLVYSVGTTKLTGTVVSVTGIFATNGKKDAAQSTIADITIDESTENGLVSALTGKLIATIGTTEGTDQFTYTMTETTAPNGYVLPNTLEISFRVDDDGALKDVQTTEVNASYVSTDTTTNKIIILNDFMQSTIMKRSETADGTTLTAAKFTLKDNALTDKQKEIQPSETGFVWTGADAEVPMIQGHTYTLSETTVPAGYVKMADVEVKVDAQGKLSTLSTGASVADGGLTLNLINQKTSLSINKVSSETENPAIIAPEMTLTLKQGDTKVFDWKHTSSGYALENTNSEFSTVEIDTTTGVIKGLPAGNYVLSETSVPNGYEKTSDMNITVSESGAVTVNDKSATDNKVIMQDTPIKLQFIKTDMSGAAITRDAVFEVSGKFANTPSGTESETKTIHTKNEEGVSTISSLDGQWIAGQSYVFKEINAPAGYELTTTTVTVKIKADGTIETVTNNPTTDVVGTADGDTLKIKNALIQITLNKKANLSGTDLLKGAEFTLTDTTDTATKPSKTVTLTDGTLTFKGTDESVPMVQGHTYELKETKAPQGYILPNSAFTINFKVSEEGKITDVSSSISDMTAVDVKTGEILSVKNDPISVVFTKQDFTDNKTLSRVTLKYKDVTNENVVTKLLRINGELTTIGTTDTDGKLTLNGLIQGHTYEVYESIYAGYQQADNNADVKVLTFTVNTDGTLALSSDTDTSTVSTSDNKPANVTLKNKRISGRIEITKVGESDEALEGAEFTIYQKNGDKLEKVTATFDGTTLSATGRTANPSVTDEKGKVVFSNLSWGDYIVKETKAPAGHKLDSSEHAFHIGPTDATVTVKLTETVKNNKTSVSFQKYDLTNTTTALSGAQFTLKASDDSTFNQGTAFADGFNASLSSDKKVIQWKSRNDLVFTLNGYLVAGKTYVLTETKAPNGYELPDTNEWTFTISESGTITWSGATPTQASIQDNQVNVFEQKINVKLEKLDADSNANLSGAVFTLTDTSTTPDVKKDVEVSSTGIVLTGTDESVPMIQGHTYKLQEKTVPAGYVQMSDVSFTIGNDGKATVVGTSGALTADNTNATAVLKAKNVKTSLTLEKLNSETNEKLNSSDLILTLKDTSGNKIFDWNYSGTYSLSNIASSITTISIDHTTGEIRGIPAGEYVLSETKTPVGYKTIPEYKFKINANGSIEDVTKDNTKVSLKNTTITAVDTVIRGTVTLTKKVEGNSLLLGRTLAQGNGIVKGTKFALYQQNGETANIASDTRLKENLEIDAEGKLSVDSLPTGKYYFVETQATADTCLDTTKKYPFVIGDTTATDADGKISVDNVTAWNKEYGASISLKKLDEVSKDPISGVTFKLTCVPEYNTNIDKLTKSGDVDSEKKTISWTLTTSNDGTILFDDGGKGLPKGTYTITEEKVATGYESVQGSNTFTASFTLNESDNGKNYEIKADAKKADNSALLTTTNGSLLTNDGIINHRTLGTLKIIKDDSTTNKTLDGVTFDLYEKNSGNVFEQIWNFITGKSYTFKNSTPADTTSGVTTISNLAWGEYYIVETKQLDGYVLSSKKYHFSVNAQTVGSPIKLYTEDLDALGNTTKTEVGDNTIHNDKTCITFMKKSTVGDKVLTGGTYQILDASDNPVSFYTNAAETGGKVTKITATADGFKIYGLKAGNYSLQETEAPAGYKLDSTKYAFTIAADGTLDGTSNTNDKFIIDKTSSQLTMKDEPIAITFQKAIRTRVVNTSTGNATSYGVGDLLSGATITVTGIFADTTGVVNANKTTETVEIKNDGVAVLAAKMIPGNTYTIKETVAPDGYLCAKDITISMDTAGNVVLSDDQNLLKDEKQNRYATIIDGKLVILDDPGRFMTHKQDSDDASVAMSGTSYTIKDVTENAGNVHFTNCADNSATEQILEANGNGNVTIAAMLLAGHTYDLYETVTKDGYISRSDKLVTLKANSVDDVEVLGALADDVVSDSGDGNKITKVKINNHKTVFAIDKKDQKGNFVKNAQISIYECKDGQAAANPVVQWKTGENDEESHIVKGLKENQLYVMKETQRPYNHETAADIYFKLSGGNAKTYSVSGSKVILCDKDGNELTDQSGIFSDVPKDDGEKGRCITHIKMVDDEIAVPVTLKKIRKDGDKKAALANVRFEIYKKDSDGNEIASSKVSAVTNADGMLVLDDEQTDKTIWLSEGSYIAKETFTPVNTYLNTQKNTIEFTITEADYVSYKENNHLVKNMVSNAMVSKAELQESVEDKASSEKAAFYNDAYYAYVELTKLDATSKEPIEGVTFTLERKNGENDDQTQKYEKVEDVSTDANGKLKITINQRGNYRITESKAVYGYAEDNNGTPINKFTATFTLDNNDNGQTFIINNAAIKSTAEGSNTTTGWLTVDDTNSKLLTDKGIINTRSLGSVTLIKKDQGSQPLSGATFTLYQKTEGDVFTTIWNFITGNSYQLVSTLEGELLDSKEEGKLIIKNLPWGDYKLVETLPKAGYIFDLFNDNEKEYTFTIGRAGENVSLTIDKGTITNQQTSITLQKKDSLSKAFVDGAEFTFTNVNDSEDVHTISLTNGKVDVTGILSANQTYEVKETTYPVGYKEDGTSFKVALDKAGKVSIDDCDYDVEADGNTITVMNTPTHLEFKKVGLVNESCAADDSKIDAKETMVLPGIEFTVYKDAAATQVATEAGNNGVLTSDMNGYVSDDNLPLGTYYIKEKKTAPGYILDENIYSAKVDSGEFEGLRGPDGKLVADNTLVNDIYRATIVINKVNEQNPDEKLPNSTYGLYKKVKKQTLAQKAMRLLSNVVDACIVEAAETDPTSSDAEYEEVFVCSATTDKDGVLRFEGVCMDTEYVIRELIATDGSYISEQPITISFKVDNEGSVQLANYSDGNGTAQVINGEITWFEPSVVVEFSKFDENGNLQPGATLAILDKDGNEVTRFTTGETATRIDRVLTIGETYQLVEVASPDGYTIASPVKFTIDDAPVGAKEDKLIKVSMQNEPTKVSIMKTDKDGNAISGAKLKVIGKFANNETSYEWVSLEKTENISGKFVLGNTYKVSEVEAPAGYEQLDKEITFSVDEDGKIVLEKQDGASLKDGVLCIENIKKDIPASPKTGGFSFPGHKNRSNNQTEIKEVAFIETKDKKRVTKEDANETE